MGETASTDLSSQEHWRLKVLRDQSKFDMKTIRDQAGTGDGLVFAGAFNPELSSSLTVCSVSMKH